MAIGIQNDLVVYQEQFYGGFVESVQSNLDVFNAAGFNTLSLQTLFHKGQRKEEAFFLKTNGIFHRDPNSTASRTPTALSADDIKKVKIKKGELYSATLDSFVTQGMSIDDMVFIAGRQAGENLIEQWRESGLNALVGAYGLASLAAGGTDELTLDDSANVNGLETSTLIQAMKLMGDKANRIRAFIMHSHAYWSLVGNQQASTTADGVADMVVMTGTPATLGKPVIVVDSPALVETDGVAVGIDAYKTFALVEGAVMLEESEQPRVLVEDKTGLDNLVRAVQYEAAFTVGLKGISYEGAGMNPTDAALATSGNWAKVYTSKKDLPGIQIIHR